MTIFSSAWRKPMSAAVPAAALLCILSAGAATPRAWFRADALAGSSGSTVSTWTDSSSSGNAAMSAAGTPSLTTNALNGLPVVHFDGSSYLTFPRPVQDDFTIVVLFRTTTDGIGTDNNFYSGAGIVSGEVGGVVNDFGISLRGGSRIMAGTGNPDTTLRTPNNRNYIDGNPHILTFTRTKATGALSLYADGQNSANDTGGTQSLVSPSRLTIGAQPGPYNFFTGDLAEIILFEGSMTATEVGATEGALRGKYGMGNGTKPVVPNGISAAGVRVGWSASVGATSYTVERSSSATGSFAVIATGVTGSYFDDPAPLAGQPNYYRVRASNPVGTSDASDVVKSISPVLPANGKVVINEIHYNGLSNAVHSDFVELFNYSAAATDVSGWTLSSGIEYTIPAGTVMAPGSYLVIAQDPSVVQSLWGAASLGPYTKSLSSDGDTIRLRNAANTTVCEVTYKSGFPWPCEANGEGASAELINPGLDPSLGSSWRSSVMSIGDLAKETASPGAQNFQFQLDAPPHIETVSSSPQQPSSSQAVTVTARLSDANGITGATLAYQVVAPGAYIPAKLPLPIVNHVIDTAQPLPANPDFEAAANWTSVPMYDDGTHGDAVAGDGLYTATVPAQPNRSLVRYRVTAVNGLGISIRAPFADDASQNFAYYVYDGVPDYRGVPSSTLTSLPVYQFISRKADYDQCVAYDTANQLTGNTPSWTFENWEAALVFDGVVYDHIRFRLHGGNGRYYFNGKRAFRMFFNKGYDFQNRDNDGNLSPTKWNSLTTENLWENRGTLTYSLNEVVNFYLWNLVGVPSPRANWGHFRTVLTPAEQADAYHGDFWGLIMIHEDYDRRFLDSHNLAKGNLYKLTRDDTDGPSQQRYQAPDAVSDGSDHDNIYNNMTPDKDAAFIRRYTNFAKWAQYHAICQAVRHYDYWPEGDNNAAYYFEPDYTGQTDHLGKLWVLPNDVDATWGPTWNDGRDRVYSATFDSPGKPELYPQYFNAVREVRDLLFQPDQINPILDQYAAVITPFSQADLLRWKNAPVAAGSYNGLAGAGYTSVASLVADMKKFAWTGGSWPGGDVGVGGRAAFLDALQLGVSYSEGGTIPITPTAAYQGAAGYPGNELTFSTTAFTDPQGAGDFAAVQWRIAEVTDASAPAYDPAAKFMPEWTAAFDSGPLTTFAATYKFPAGVTKTGHSYRVRVRHQDITGRWSHWSSPVAFIAGASNDDLPVVVSEMLYKPHNPSTAEIAAGFSDQEMFEYIELTNVGTAVVDLAGANFDKGVTYTFPANSTLAPGASVLVVANQAAFNFRYGTGRNVSGVYVGNLKNSGERIRLLGTGGSTLVDFTYSDQPPWPTAADTDGCSLVLIDPASRPDPNVATNWRASAHRGGAPGYADAISFSGWAAAHQLTGGMNDDDDRDGLSNGLEYALGTDPLQANPAPAGTLQTLTVDGVDGSYLTLSFSRRLDATDLNYHVESSTDLSGWQSMPVLVNSVDHYDGTVTETWRTAASSTGNRQFLRIRIGD